MRLERGWSVHASVEEWSLKGARVVSKGKLSPSPATTPRGRMSSLHWNC